MEFLKDVLGEELYNQVSEKLSGNDKIRLVNAADGTWIPKDKLDAELTNVKSLRKQIGDLNGQLGALQSANSDNEALKSQIAQMQSDIAKKDAEIAQNALEYDAMNAIRERKPRNAKAVRNMIDMSKVSKDEKGNIVGLSDQLDALLKSDAYMFEDAAGERGGVDAHQEPSGNVGKNFSINQAIRSAVGR